MKKVLVLFCAFMTLIAFSVLAAPLTKDYVPKNYAGGAVMVDSLIYSATNVGIGTVATQSKLEVVGTVTATAFSGPVTGDVTGDVTGNVIGNVTGNLTGNVTGGINWTDATAFGTGSSVSADKFTGSFNWTDLYLFQQAYSGINWTDAHYICFDDNGVPSSDADGICP